MKIYKRKEFIIGIIICSLSIIPFSYFNNFKKIKIENCDSISGTLKETYTTQKNPGIILKLEEHKFKIRIIGNKYNTNIKQEIERLTQLRAYIKIYILKKEHHGIFENLNQKTGFIDAQAIEYKNKNILDINIDEAIIKRNNIICIISGLIFLILGLCGFYDSMKKPKPIN